MSENLKMEINWNHKIKNFVYNGVGLDELLTEKNITSVTVQCEDLHEALLMDLEKSGGEEMGVTLNYGDEKFLKLYQHEDIYKVKIIGVYKDDGKDVERVVEHGDLCNAIIDLVIHILHENEVIDLGRLEELSF